MSASGLIELPGTFRSSSCRSFSRYHLSREGESVGKEELRKACELFDVFVAELFIVMSTLISIQTNHMPPVFQVLSELPRFIKSINSRGQILAGKSCIKLSCRKIDCFSVHGCCCVRLAPGRIVFALQKRALDRIRDVRRRLRLCVVRIYAINLRPVPSANVCDVARLLLYPRIYASVSFEQDANQVEAAVAMENYRRVTSLRQGRRDIGHPDLGRSAVRAICNVGDRHG